LLKLRPRAFASNEQPATSSSLLLLVLGVRADHPNDAFAADDLAVFTDSLHARSHFHDGLAFDNSQTFHQTPENRSRLGGTEHYTAYEKYLNTR
jgi:hypothetical protein